MPITIKQSAFAVWQNCPVSFLGTDGTAPYTYQVIAGGAGGVINASSGRYTAPVTVSSGIDTIRVTDSVGGIAESEIKILHPILLTLEIIEREMGLANGRVYLFDQKINQPKDSGIYIPVMVEKIKPYANNNRNDGTSQAYITVQAQLGINIISRSNLALFKKEEVLLALNSNYSKNQQTLNSFYIAPISTDFVNLSDLDGSAIPYRYHISTMIHYCYTKSKAFDYFDTIDFNVTTEA
jgi:hypothetical protein